MGVLQQFYAASFNTELELKTQFTDFSRLNFKDIFVLLNKRRCKELQVAKQ